jgi:hypothetical protein
MLRKEPAKYWASPELQRQHHEAIAAAIRETPQPVAQPAAAPNLSASPAAAPAAPAPTPAKAAVSDATRRAEIEALMRVDGGKAYWRDPGVQREYGQVLARLAGEAPPLARPRRKRSRCPPLRRLGRKTLGEIGRWKFRYRWQSPLFGRFAPSRHIASSVPCVPAQVKPQLRCRSFHSRIRPVPAAGPPDRRPPQRAAL